jgi:hypothetical protein
MITLDAVLVVQFGQSVMLGVFAVGLVDIPTAKSPVKFAHVELGIAATATADFDYGVFKAEAPNSYILHKDCHLTGGFALYAWFDAPHADRAKIRSFVFTLGGYHQAYVDLEAGEHDLGGTARGHREEGELLHPGFEGAPYTAVEGSLQLRNPIMIEKPGYTSSVVKPTPPSPMSTTISVRLLGFVIF